MVLSLVGVSLAARLDGTYLPPPGAAAAGGFGAGGGFGGPGLGGPGFGGPGFGGGGRFGAGFGSGGGGFAGNSLILRDFISPCNTVYINTINLLIGGIRNISTTASIF